MGKRFIQGGFSTQGRLGLGPRDGREVASLSTHLPQNLLSFLGSSLYLDAEQVTPHPSPGGLLG